MPVNYIDRYKIRPEDWYEAEQWARGTAKRLGLVCDKQISAITVYSSEDFWMGGDKPEINPDIVTLVFNLGDHWREPYLRSIQFDPGQGKDPLPIPQVEWRVSETSGGPPATLEEFMEEAPGGKSPRLRKRAQEFPAFFELYTGIYERLFPQVEHEHLHTDVGNYEEAKLPPSHLKKEIWRTDLLTSLQGLRFPEMEIETGPFPGQGRQSQGARVIWQPQGHTNYRIWFNLYVGEDPKVCVYGDPSLSGSTTGWLSTRLIKNEAALAKLPYTLEQWAREDLKKLSRDSAYASACTKIRELLRHHIPREFEEAWEAIRRQITPVIGHEEIHTDIGNYDESKRLITSDDEAFLFHLPVQFQLKG